MKEREEERERGVREKVKGECRVIERRKGRSRKRAAVLIRLRASDPLFGAIIRLGRCNTGVRPLSPTSISFS